MPKTTDKKLRGAAVTEQQARNAHLQAIGLWQIYEDYSIHDARDSGVSTNEIMVLAIRHSQRAFKASQGALLVNGKNEKDKTLDMAVNFKYKTPGYSYYELKTVHRKCAIRHHKRLEDRRLQEIPNYVPVSKRIPTGKGRMADGARLDRATETFHGSGPGLSVADTVELGRKLESEFIVEDGT